MSNVFQYSYSYGGQDNKDEAYAQALKAVERMFLRQRARIVEQRKLVPKRSPMQRSALSMSEVSTFRLYLLRAMYLFMAVGLAIFELPRLLHPEILSRLDSVVLSVLAAFALLAVVGIRYPLKMLPLLFFEFVWKSVWVLAFGLPPLLSGRLDPNTTETLTACLMGVVLVPLVTPWGYVFKHYLKAPGDRWGKQVTALASESTNPDDGVSTDVHQPAVVPSSNGRRTPSKG